MNVESEAGNSGNVNHSHGEIININLFISFKMPKMEEEKNSFKIVHFEIDETNELNVQLNEQTRRITSAVILTRNVCIVYIIL